MILFANYSYNDLQAALNDRVRKQVFERMLLKTRFEDFSEYIWLMLNAYKRSFVFDLEEDTNICIRNTISYKKELCELLALMTECKTKGHDLELTMRNGTMRASLSNKKFIDELYAMMLHDYTCYIDNAFDPDLNPDEMSLDDSFKMFLETNGTVGRRGAPFKNTRAHCALMSIAATCEPNYNAADINESIGFVESRRTMRMRDIFEDITVNEVMFNNDVQFSNEDCRVVYDILMFFGYLRPDEECASRDNARFIKQLVARSKVVKMACLYRTDRKSGAERNIKMIREISIPFVENSATVTDDRNNDAFANSSKI